MIAADLATFRELFPEFATISDTVVSLWLNMSLDTLSKANWGNCYNTAVLYFTAHLLAVSLMNTNNAAIGPNGEVVINTQSGNTSGMSADKLSINFAVSRSMSDGNDNQVWLQKTPYGQFYAALKVRCLAHGRVVRC